MLHRITAETSLRLILPPHWRERDVPDVVRERGVIMPTPNFRPSESFTPRMLLIHSTQQATPNDFAALWTLTDPNRRTANGGDATVSCHFAIPHDMGKHPPPVVMMLPTRYRAWHAGDSDYKGWGTMEGRVGPYPTVNNVAIGNEIHAMRGEGISPNQYEMLRRWVRDMLDMHSLHAEDVKSHAEVCLPAGRKDDPDIFDWSQLSDYGLAEPR